MGKAKKTKEVRPAIAEVGKTIQTPIVKRFMTDAEWYEFRKEYFAHRKHSMNREQSLAIEISEEDMAMLSSYLLDTDLTVAEIAETNHTTNSDVHNRVRRAALRLLYQNQEVLSKLIK